MAQQGKPITEQVRRRGRVAGGRCLARFMPATRASHRTETLGWRCSAREGRCGPAAADDRRRQLPPPPAHRPSLSRLLLFPVQMSDAVAAAGQKAGETVEAMKQKAADVR